MMKIPIALQIKIFKIINVSLIACIILTGYLMFLESQNMEPHILTEKLENLKGISGSKNPKVGVYLKLVLKYPKYAKFGGKGLVGVLIISNSSVRVVILIKNKTGNEKEGFLLMLETKITMV